MAARNRIVIEGRLGTAETWSTSLQFGGVGPEGLVTAQADLELWANDVGIYLASVFTGSGSLATALSDEGRVTQVTAQYYNPANELAAQATDVPDQPILGTGTMRCPYQVSVVGSLRTGLPGASFRGRLYWPALGLSPSAGGFLQASQTTALANAFVDLGEAARDASPGAPGARWAVYSPTRDVLTEITTVQVGNVLDTQRRRRDGLQESYSSSPVATIG